MTITTLLGSVKEFFSTIFSTTTGNEGLATQLVNWIGATPVAQIGIILFILVSVAGVARRFIPGV